MYLECSIIQTVGNTIMFVPIFSLQKRKQKREYSLHSREGNTHESNIKSAAEVDIERIPG